MLRLVATISSSATYSEGHYVNFDQAMLFLGTSDIILLCLMKLILLSVVTSSKISVDLYDIIMYLLIIRKHNNV